MIVLYNLFIYILSISTAIASLFNTKAKSFTEGRKNLFDRLSNSLKQNKSPLIWMHCASLGEFEQGRPIIEKLKAEFLYHKILLTFFSPSGFEVQKNYEKADFIFYLPLDSPSNAKKFVAITKPILAIFVKYEFWYHHCNELKKQRIPLISISAIFREDQLFFKWYGKFYRNVLYTFSYFFVQNDTSIRLLKGIDITRCSRAGDTRFDRVYQIVQQGGEIPIIEKFKGNEKVFVVGSCWPEDMEVLIPFINENSGKVKFIIAPHEISDEFIQDIQSSLMDKSIRYSIAMHNNHIDEFQTLIIDNIGMLSRLYRYGEFAFVGGGFGKGIHNILEAACYGVPIFFGDLNYEKYEEANQLIKRGGAFEVADYNDLKAKYESINIPENFLLACEVTKQYVHENLGATDKIMAYCRNTLKSFA